MIRMRKLKEDSYTQEDIPKQFFIVTSYEQLNTSDISKGIIQGVTGVSGSAHIVLDFMGVGRNCILTMDGEEVVRNNRLTRIMYDNPHYLVSNDMDALFRIWQKSKSSSFAYTSVFENFFDHTKVWLKKQSDDIYEEILGRWTMGGTPAMKMRDAWTSNNKEVKNLKDFVDKLRDVLEDIEDYNGKSIIERMSYREFYNMIEGTLEVVSDIYKGESEWVLKDKTLNIPKGSLFVFGLPLDTFNKWRDGLLTDQEKFFMRDDTFEDWERLIELSSTIDRAGFDYDYMDIKKFQEVQSRILSDRSDSKIKVNKLLSKYPILEL